MDAQTERYAGWVQRYLKAWESNDPDDISSLFSEDARYYDDPYKDPWAGRDQIVREWLERRDTPGDWTFEHEVMAANERVGFVRGRTRYKTSGKDYVNLWEIHLDANDNASKFVEWYSSAHQAAMGPDA